MLLPCHCSVTISAMSKMTRKRETEGDVGIKPLASLCLTDEKQGLAKPEPVALVEKGVGMWGNLFAQLRLL